MPSVAVPKQRALVHDLHCAKGEEIDRPEGLGVVEIGGEAKQVVGDEVVRVLGELGAGESDGEGVQRVGGDDEEQDPADDLDDAIDALEDDADVEGPVEDATLLGRVVRRLRHLDRFAVINGRSGVSRSRSSKGTKTRGAIVLTSIAVPPPRTRPAMTSPG